MWRNLELHGEVDANANVFDYIDVDQFLETGLFSLFYHQSCFLAPQPNMVGLRAFTEENSQVEDELAQVPEQEEPWQEYRKERSEEGMSYLAEEFWALYTEDRSEEVPHNLLEMDWDSLYE